MSAPSWNSTPREIAPWREPRPFRPERMTGIRYCTAPGCGSRVRVADGEEARCRCGSVITIDNPRTP